MPGDRDHKYISKTRIMTVPTETPRAASLEEGHRNWARKFYCENLSTWAFLYMCMGSSIDRKVNSCLIEAGVEPADRRQPVATECTGLNRLKPKGLEAETCQRKQSAPHWCQCCDRQSEVFEPSEMFQIMVSEEVKGTNCNPDESSDDDTPVATSNLDRVLALGSGGSGATDHLWDHTDKGLFYDTKPSSKSYGSDGSGNNQPEIIKGVVTGKEDILSVLNLWTTTTVRRMV